MKLFLVRHGETAANLNKVLQGHTQVPLTKRGIEQAKLLGVRLRSREVDAVYSSDLLRARQTAEEVVRGRSLPITYTAELRERCYGVFQGKPVAHYEAALLQSKLPRDEFRPEGGESYLEVRERVKVFLAQMLLKHPRERVLFVSHSGTNRVLLHLLAKNAEVELITIEQDNACLNEIEISATGKVTQILVNCTAHLGKDMFEPLGMQE